MNKILLIIGNDKIGTKGIYEIEKLNYAGRINILIDKSSNFKRIIRLFMNKILSLNLIFRLVISEFLRKKHKIQKYDFVKNSKDLKYKINFYKPDLVILYRCGLILSKDILELQPIFLNIHASSLPKYGGLGTIHRALKDNSFDQNATLHKVIAKIDSGKVIDENPYKLKKQFSYFKNEKIAYDAACNLLIRSVDGFLNENNYKNLIK